VSVRYLALYLAPLAKDAGADPSSGALVPTSHLAQEALRVRARLLYMLPVAFAAVMALVFDLAQLRFPDAGRSTLEGPRGAASTMRILGLTDGVGLNAVSSWVRGLDLPYWASLSHSVVDATSALSLIWLTFSVVVEGDATPWTSAASGLSITDIAAEKARRRAARLRAQPVLQDADDDWLTGGAAHTDDAKDPNLVRDADGDLAHEFWRAVPRGGFERDAAAR